MSTESKDSLQSKAVLTLLDLIGEGEIGGLVDGLKSVYLNDTPIQNADGTFNFQGVTGSWTNGTNDQAPLPNFGNFSESPFTAGVQVKANTPYTFTISSPVADAVRVIVSLPALSYTNPDSGDIGATTVKYKFSRSINNGPFVDIGAGTDWVDTGTISNTTPPTATASFGSIGVRATLNLTYNGSGSLTTDGVTNTPTPDSVVVQAQEFDGTTWRNLGGQKTLQAQWVSTGDFQSGGSDGDRFYTYAVATDPYIVESNYAQVRFNIVSRSSTAVGIEITKVQSKINLPEVTISGKSRSRYQRSHVLQIPRPASSVRFRVTRITPDSTSAYLANETWVDSYAEITTLNMRYPNTALFGMRIDSQQFNSIPNRAYLVDGLKIQVPTNYDPVARTYTGAWDGTFKRAVSSNPAWILYDLLTNTRYGLGNFISASQVDKATLYTIGKYCDEMVPDGFGGTEPRFTLNTVIGSQGEAYKLISDITSVFRGMGYWDGGIVKFTQDAPSDPVMLYTAANVVDGSFAYTGSSRKDRHSVVHVTWNDPEDNYKRKVEYVEDAELIAKYGVKKLDTLAFGCTSRGEAARVGRWILYTERYESDFITFKVGLDAAFVAPGDIIKIHDVMRAGKRAGGRLMGCTLTGATLDAPVEITSTPAVISLMMPDGTFMERQIINGVGTHSAVTFSGSLTVLPLENAVYMISEPQLEPVLARVVSVNQDGSSATTFEITAVESKSSKYGFIESGLSLEKRKTSLLDPNFIEAPTNLRFNEATYESAPGVLANKVIASWYGNSTTYEVSWRGVSETNATNWQKATVAGGLTFEVLGVLPGTYEFSIVGINPLGGRSSAVTASYVVNGKLTPPSDVANFSAQEVNGGIRLSWNAVGDIDLKSYEIRKSATVGGSWESATTVATVAGVTTSYSVGPVTSGTTHEWQIRAIDSSGNYSQSATVVTFTKAVASNIAVSYQYELDNVRISWTSTAQPTAWRVKRGPIYDTASVVVRSTTDNTVATSVIWTTSQTFWVAPLDATGAEGPAAFVNVPFSFPGAPTITGNQLGASLLLEWTTPTSTLPIKQYELRWGTSFASGVAIGTFVGNKAIVPITWVSDTTIWIAAVDTNNNTGAVGSISYVAQLPHAPVNLTATAGLGTITLKWDNPTYPAHAYAEIYRSNSSSFSEATAIARSEVNTFSDAVGSTSATRYYWVRFVSQSLVAGTFSNAVSATTGLVGGVDLSNLVVTAEKLAADAVEAGKIKDGAVTTTKIANLAVGNAAIQNAAITNAKIADLAVDNAKIASLDATKITTGLLVADRIDSRGLSIKDLAGNIILAAGTPLDYSYVGGSTAPQPNATRNVFRGDWTSGTAYSIGDIVVDGGNGWSCIAAHTASTGNRPPASSTGTSAYWTLYAVKGADGQAGAAGLTVVLSNEAHSLPADNSGAVTSYTGSGTTIQVFEGTTALTASASATTSAFRIGTITQSPASTITVGAVSYAGTFATIGAHSAMASGTDAVTLTIPITVYRADGTASIVNKVQTISKSKAGVQGTAGAAGQNAVVGYLTNESVTVAADSAGTVSSFSSAGGTFKVFNGTTDVTTSATFSVASSTGVTIAIGASTGVYTVSAMSADTGTATLRAVYSGVTIDKVYNIAKSKAGTAGANGTNGANAQTLDLTSTAQAFTFDGTGTATPASQTISFTANLQNITGTATFTATPYDSAGTAGAAITMGGTGNTRTLTNAQFASAQYVVVTATLSGLSDTITIVRLKDGAAAKLVDLSASSQVFQVSKTAVASPSSITLTATGQNVAGGSTPTFTVTSGTATLTGTGNTRTLTYANMSTDTATVSVTWDGLSDSITIAKVREGTDGTNGTNGTNGANAVIGVLSNEAHTVPADSAGTVSTFAGAVSTMSVFNGTTDDSANWTYSVTKTNVTTTEATTSRTQTVTAMSADIGYVDFTASRSGYSSITKRFTITKSKAGANGTNGTNGADGSNATAYWLVPGVAAIQKSAAGVYTPTTLTVTAYSATGTNAPAAYTGRFIIATTTDGTTFNNVYTSAANESSYTYTVPANIKAIRIRGYIAGGTTTLFDEQLVPIVVDGTNGANGTNGSNGLSALTVVMSNEAHTVPADSTGAVTSYTGSGTTIQVYEGATALTASATGTTSAFRIGTITQSPASSITVGAVSYASTTATIAQHSAMSSSVDAVTLTIPVTIYRADGTSSTINKIQTITKSKAGATGATGATGPQGPSVLLTTDRAATFTATDGTLDAGQSDIVFTAQVSGVTSPTYAWSFSGLQTNPTASTTSTQTITAAQFGTSKSAIVTCTVNGTFVDKITIVRLERSTAAAGATKNTIYRQATAPTVGVVDGDIWIENDVTPNIQFVRVSGAWQVAATAGATFDTTATAGVISGQITSTNVGTFIADAAITNAKIGNVIQSSSYVAGSAGWRIDKTGAAEFNNATFRGTLDVKSSASGARTEIKNNFIKVYDASGVLRVQIGDLSA